MVAVDTNILVYAHRRDAEAHDRARDLMKGLAEGGARWAIPVPCAHEFLAVVTRRNLFADPTPAAEALLQLSYWIDSPTLQLIAPEPSPAYWKLLQEQVRLSGVTGAEIHDAVIATTCVQHRVEEFWTSDRDFRRFEGLAVHNPLA